VTEIDPAEPLLQKLTPEVRALMQQLRAVVPEVIPQVSEKFTLAGALFTSCSDALCITDSNTSRDRRSRASIRLTV